MPRELMSAEEFREYVDNTLDRDDVTDEYQLIYNARDWYSKSRNARLEESEKDYYKNLYIKRLLDFGFRSKGRWDDSGYQAQERFERALGLDQNLPIAHYRLGHIYYRQEKFAQASAEFDKALEMSLDAVKYGLDNIQQANARKVMAFCALKTFESVKEFVSDYDNYPELNDLIQSYNTKLSSELYPIIVDRFSEGNEEMLEMTRDQYYEIVNSKDSNTLFFDSFSHENCVGYNGREVPITFDNFKLFRDLINPKRFDINNHAHPGAKNREAMNNSFNQKLSRLRNKISALGLSNDQFTIVKHRNGKPHIQTSLTLLFFKRIDA